MNTPRQANVRPSVGTIAGDNRNIDPGGRPSTSFVLPIKTSSSPVPIAAGIDPKEPNPVRGSPSSPIY
jgi:hypothetical protein